MSRRKELNLPLSQRPVPSFLPSKARPPLAIILGSPAEIVHLLETMPDIQATCFQFDMFQADRVRAELKQAGLRAEVIVGPDPWDLGDQFQTAIYMPARGGERELKIDMIEQSYHILRDHGSLIVWSPYEGDPFFPNHLKKVFSKVHTPPHEHSEDKASVLWCVREKVHPRRRHEITFQVKIGQGPSCRFLSRPGTFSYGKFDNGARALCEVMEIEPGDRVLDLGCGVGTNGVFAWQKTGEHGFISFVDSNSRACSLAELNARNNGVNRFEVFPTSTVEGPEKGSFDVVLANPPYYANNTIAQMFIHRAKEMLTPQGRFFLVTRQPAEMGEIFLEVFGEGDVVENRGYFILCG